MRVTARTMEQTNALIEAAIRDMLGRLGIPFTDIVASPSQGTTVFTIRTDDSRVVIGPNGDTLSAINHLVKKMLESKLPDERITIDVNGYYQKKVKSMEDQARVVAERARTFKYDIELPPMSAYERMIVHSTLKEMPDIETSSHGEGKLRHIIVRYVDPAAPKPITAP